MRRILQFSVGKRRLTGLEVRIAICWLGPHIQVWGLLRGVYSEIEEYWACRLAAIASVFQCKQGPEVDADPVR
jgi:hypothetical protein